MHTFRQDGDGDWDLDQAREHNEFNEITGIDGAAAHVAHDRCGNMTRTPKPDDWGAHFDLTYDAWNRLVRVEDGASQDLIAEYEYDGRNYRITKTLRSELPNSSSSSSGTTTDTETRHFYYNHAWQCLEERLEADPDPSSSSGTPGDPPSTLDRQFTWGARYIDDLILRDRATSTPPDNELDERLYAVQDPNWNVGAAVCSSGTIAERHYYEPYGMSLCFSGCFGARPGFSAELEFRFTARRQDSESGLYYQRTRHYHTSLGRWTAPDVMRYAAGDVSLYRYVGNNPVMSSDPFGLSTGELAIPRDVQQAMIQSLARAAQMGRGHLLREAREWVQVLLMLGVVVTAEQLIQVLQEEEGLDIDVEWPQWEEPGECPDTKPKTAGVDPPPVYRPRPPMDPCDRDKSGMPKCADVQARGYRPGSNAAGVMCRICNRGFKDVAVGTGSEMDGTGKYEPSRDCPGRDTVGTYAKHYTCKVKTGGGWKPNVSFIRCRCCVAYGDTAFVKPFFKCAPHGGE